MNFDNCKQLLQNVYERFYEHMPEDAGEGYFESRPYIADDFIKLRYYVFPFALEKKHEQVFGSEFAPVFSRIRENIENSVMEYGRDLLHEHGYDINPNANFDNFMDFMVKTECKNAIYEKLNNLTYSGAINFSVVIDQDPLDNLAHLHVLADDYVGDDDYTSKVIFESKPFDPNNREQKAAVEKNFTELLEQSLGNEKRQSVEHAHSPSL